MFDFVTDYRSCNEIAFRNDIFATRFPCPVCGARFGFIVQASFALSNKKSVMQGRTKSENVPFWNVLRPLLKYRKNLTLESNLISLYLFTTFKIFLKFYRIMNIGS